MEVSADTAGRCCWPGQVWSNTRQSCIGIPQCPTGLAPQGEACVTARAAPAPSPPAAAAAAAAQPADAPTAAPVENGAPLAAREVDGILVPPGHHLEKRMRLGLLIPGIAMAGVGWLLGIGVSIGGAIWTAVNPGDTCIGHVAATAWIPLLGPIIAIAGLDNPALTSVDRRPGGGYYGCKEGPDNAGLYAGGVAVAVVVSILQWGGAAMTVLGIVLKRSLVVEDQVVGARELAPHWYVAVGAPGSPLGITVGLKGW
jgi:hypothetical protein